MSRAERWTGQILSALGVLFLAFDATIKLIGIRPVLDSELVLGLPAGLSFKLGVLEIILLALYLVRPTRVLGALLWTGYLGGALLAQLRIGAPLWSHILFPIYIASLLWIPLWIQEPRLRALLPLDTPA